MTEWVPLKRVAQLRYGDALPSESRRAGNVSVVGSGGVSGTHDMANASGPAIVVGRKGSYGAVHWTSGVSFVIDTAYVIDRRMSRADIRWLYYVLSSVDLKGASQDVGVPGLSRDAAHSILIPEPPSLVRQRRIADFLDSETHQIDQIIAARLKWGRLVRDRWITQVHDDISSVAVGQFPLKRVLVRPPQYGAQESGDLGEAGWPRYIRITDLTEHGELREGDVRRLHPAVARQYMLRDGDILLARSGATVGKGFRYRIEMGPACFAGYLIRIQADPSLVHSAYIDHWLRTEDYWSQIRSASVQSTIQNVNAERFASLLLPYASLDSQLAVIDRATRRKVEVDRAAAVAQRQVDLLAERRQALITAAVTGQIDVTTARGVDV